MSDLVGNPKDGFPRFTPQLSFLSIVVEDPSENFQRLRDFVDARNCMKLKSFKPASLLEGWDDDMAWEAREKYKINRVRRIC